MPHKLLIVHLLVPINFCDEQCRNTTENRYVRNESELEVQWINCDGSSVEIDVHKCTKNDLKALSLSERIYMKKSLKIGPHYCSTVWSWFKLQSCHNLNQSDVRIVHMFYQHHGPYVKIFHQLRYHNIGGDQAMLISVFDLA